MKRFLLISLAVVAILVAIGYFLVNHYLSSPHVAGQVATRIESLYGGPVHIERADVGMHGSSVHGFALYEQGADPKSAEPWLTVASLSTDLSLLDILRGTAVPRHVTIDGARVVLRFDADGRLVTQFPRRPPSAGNHSLTDLPDVVLQQSEVVFQKAGEPELIARNVQARLIRGKGDTIELSGTADSAELGELTLSGNLDPATRQATATAKTKGSVPVAQPLLNRLPFIPRFALQEVRIDKGESPAELTVRYNLADDDCHFHLALHPEHATVQVPLLDLAADDAHGDLTMDDYLMKLRNTAGKAYGGAVQLQADLDFRSTETKLDFPKVVLKNLDVDKVPASWDVPRTVRKLFAGGKLSGTVSVDVAMIRTVATPAGVDALIGMASSTGAARWLPAVALLPALEQHQVHTQSQGKATITGVSGGTADIDLRLGPRSATPPPPTKFSTAPPSEEPVLLTMYETALVGAQAAGPADAYPEINVQLSRWGTAFMSGIHRTVNGIVDFGERFVAAVPKKVTPAPPGAPTDCLDLNLRLNNVDLGLLAKSLGAKVETPIEGKVSFQVKASIPTNRAGDVKEYKATGSAQVTNLLFAGVRMASLDANVNYADGILTLSSLKGRLTPLVLGQPPDAGTVRGGGTLQFAPLGDFTVNLLLDRIPVDAIAGAAVQKLAVGGTLSGQFALRGLAAQLNSLDALEGIGKLTSERLTAEGLTLDQLSALVELKNGVLSLSNVNGKLDGAPIAAKGELRLSGAYPFQARLSLKNWSLSSLMNLTGKAKVKQLPAQVAGSFTTTVDAAGALTPFKVAISGDADAKALKLANFQVDNVRFHWATDGAKLELSKVDLHLYGGEATGSAVVPLTADAAGTVNLKVRQLDTRDLVKDLKLPVKIEGKVDGTIKGTLPPAGKGGMRTAIMDLDVSAPKLRVQNIPTEALRGKLDYKNGVIDYKLEGKTLGGTFEVNGQIPSAQPVQKESRKGKLRVDNVSLSRLVKALNLDEVVPIHGRLSIAIDFTHNTPTREPEGSGLLRIAELRWKDRVLAPALDGELVIANGMVRLRELSGEIAQGSARLKAALHLRDLERSRFALALEGIDVAQLMEPFTGDKLKGTVSARVRGTLGETWHGNADVDLTQATVYGMEVAQWRIPIDWQYAPATDRVQVDIHDTTAHVAHGRLSGKLSAAKDYFWRVKGNVTFSGVDLHTLMKPLVGSTQVAAGQVTGRFDFSGDQMQSISDLNGTLAAAFSQAQALRIPVLQAITPVIGMGPSTTFQRGDLKASLNRGVLRVRKLALVGGTFQLYADGTVGVASGSLSLNVVAKAGDGGLPALRLGALRIPITGPLPITALQEASALLANQLVHVQITGSIHRPVVRVRPLPLLTEEAARFFLFRANAPTP